HLVAGPSEEPPPPPLAPIPALTLESLGATEPLSKGLELVGVLGSHAYGAAEHVLFQKNRLEPWMCTFTATKASCHELPGAMKTAMNHQFVGNAEDGATPLIATVGDAGAAVYRSDTGELLLARSSASAGFSGR